MKIAAWSPVDELASIFNGGKNQTMHLKVLIEKQDIRARHGFVYDLAPLIDVEDGFFYFYIDKVMYSFC